MILYICFEIAAIKNERKEDAIVKNVMATIIAKTAMFAAIKSANSTCTLYFYQPKEPKKLKKLRKF